MVKKWETLFLIVMTLPIMGHVVLLPLTLDVAGRDGWVSVFFALPVGILVAYAIFRVRLRFPGQDFTGFASVLCTKPLGILLQLLFAVYLLFLCSLSISSLADMTKIAFLPETPSWH